MALTGANIWMLTYQRDSLINRFQAFNGERFGPHLIERECGIELSSR
jgi:hypothetical protein